MGWSSYQTSRIAFGQKYAHCSSDFTNTATITEKISAIHMNSVQVRCITCSLQLHNMSYRVDDVDFNSQQVKLFPFSKRPDRLWGQSVLFNRYCGWSGSSTTLTTHLFHELSGAKPLPPRQTFVGFTTKLYILQLSNCSALKMGSTDFPETSVTNYQSMLHDIPEDQKSQGIVVCLKGAKPSIK